MSIKATNHTKKLQTIVEHRASKSSSSKEQDITEYCSYCLKKAAFVCGKCQLLYYCSKVCQMTDWSEHKKECFYLIKNDEELLKIVRPLFKSQKPVNKIITFTYEIFNRPFKDFIEGGSNLSQICILYNPNGKGFDIPYLGIFHSSKFLAFEISKESPNMRAAALLKKTFDIEGLLGNNVVLPTGQIFTPLELFAKAKVL